MRYGMVLDKHSVIVNFNFIAFFSGTRKCFDVIAIGHVIPDPGRIYGSVEK